MKTLTAGRSFSLADAVFSISFVLRHPRARQAPVSTLARWTILAKRDCSCARPARHSTRQRPAPPPGICSGVTVRLCTPNPSTRAVPLHRPACHGRTGSLLERCRQGNTRSSARRNHHLCGHRFLPRSTRLVQPVGQTLGSLGPPGLIPCSAPVAGRPTPRLHP